MIIPNFMRAGFAILLTFTAAAIAALYVNENTAEWFNSLSKPLLFSPSLASIAFIILVTYILMAISSSLMWIHDHRPHDFRGWVPMFFTHLLLNVAWIVLFFGFNVVFLALLLAFVIAVYVLLLVCGAWETHRLSSYLLMPYLAWTLYALGMNIAIWLAN